MDPIEQIVNSLTNARDEAEELNPENVSGLNAALTIAKDIQTATNQAAWEAEHDW